MITGCNYKVSDSVFVARREGLGGVEGDDAWLESGGGVGQGGGTQAGLKNPLLIDFKW